MKRSLVICVAAACLVQGCCIGIYYQLVRGELSTFRSIRSMGKPVGCLVKAAYQ